mmetsp:Transcript_31902/g.101571  ORF Transcript_31902/g.101571 Transcript_31902/m.101571 type:complete len:207 (-) Transcript_31902:2125-2745(-)
MRSLFSSRHSLMRFSSSSRSVWKIFDSCCQCRIAFSMRFRRPRTSSLMWRMPSSCSCRTSRSCCRMSKSLGIVTSSSSAPSDLLTRRMKIDCFRRRESAVSVMPSSSSSVLSSAMSSIESLGVAPVSAAAFGGSGPANVTFLALSPAAPLASSAACFSSASLARSMSNLRFSSASCSWRSLSSAFWAASWRWSLSKAAFAFQVSKV